METSTDDSVVKCVDPARFDHILKFVSGHLPVYCQVYNMLLSAIMSKDPSYRVYILVSREDEGVDNPLAIVALDTQKYYVSNSDELRPKRIVTSWSSTDSNAIIKIFRSIAIFDWARDAFLTLSLEHERDACFNHFLSVRFNTKDLIPFSIRQYLMERSTAMALKIEIPDEVYVDSLKSCNSQQVYEFFPHQRFSTLENVTKEIEQLPSIGIFLKENNQLVSWMTQRSTFGIGRLFTLEAHRRRGYALLAVHSLSKKIAEAGFIPMLYVDFDNDASHALMIKAGYRYNQTIACVLVEPSVN